MTDIEHARMLLIMARKDLTALCGMTDPGIFAEEVFGFHAQQAVEKSLKAWLSLQRVGYPKTHDISLLIRLLEQQRVEVDALWDLVEYNV